MLDIDGAHGEGGGQLARTAVALSAITGIGLRLHDIRARRLPPGLAPQHVAAIKAVAQLCQARTEGLAVGAREIVFEPGQLRGGTFVFEVGTAGSVTLVLQAALPVAIACPEPVYMVLRGGTDIRAAPPLDYFAHIILPLLERIGVHADLEVRRRGYYPRGGGEIALNVRPAIPGALRLEQPGAVEEIGGMLHTAGLPGHVLDRMLLTVSRAFVRYPQLNIETRSLTKAQALGQGGAAVIWARTNKALLGGSEVAQRGVPAERIAQTAADALKAEIAASATLDVHAADQLLVYFALAREPSCFRVRALTSHVQTTQWLLQRFLPVRFQSAISETCIRVDVFPSVPENAVPDS